MKFPALVRFAQWFNYFQFVFDFVVNELMLLNNFNSRGYGHW